MKIPKYQAWVIAEKRMLSVSCIDFTGTEIQKGTPCIVSKPGDGCYALKDVILREYIGLNDKNGDNIYWGDICKSYTEYIHEVVFENGAFGYNIMGEFIPFASNHHFKWVDGQSEKIEILGNRFENPELIDTYFPGNNPEA